LFVPALLDVFTEAGLTVDYVGAEIDPRKLLDDQPDLVFLDTDFLENPLEDVRVAHVLVPKAKICVYSTAHSETISRAFVSAGAEMVLEKSADRRTIVQGLREVDRRRRERSSGR
jgi:DNA-binding NarL/FixJ family response regulator